jgi:hypothetical protein
MIKSVVSCDQSKVNTSVPQHILTVKETCHCHHELSAMITCGKRRVVDVKRGFKTDLGLFISDSEAGGRL